MRSVHEIEECLDGKFRRIAETDRSEIDNRDRHHFIRLNYKDRMDAIIALVKRYYPVPAGVKVGDFAAAQGNMSLALAEAGYKVFSLDIDPTFVEYSKLKYEKGDMTWIVGNIDTVEFPAGLLDVAIAGEIVEHCAYPEDIIAKILAFLKPGGLLIITTPNGSRVLNRLPTFGQVYSKDKRKMYEARQFKPYGESHLFLFRLEELGMIVPPNAGIVEKGYLGGTVIYNKIDQAIFRLVPVRFIAPAIRLSASLPLVNRYTCNNVYAVVRKKHES